MANTAALAAASAAAQNLANVRNDYKKQKINFSDKSKNETQTTQARASQAASQGIDFEALSDFFANTMPKILQSSSGLNINSTDAVKHYDNSEILNSHINSDGNDSWSDCSNSFIPKMTTNATQEPSPAIMSQMTGDGFNSVLLEIANAMAEFFSSMPKQINLMTTITNASSMSLWKLLSATSVAAGKNYQADVDKQVQSARDSAEKAGHCMALTGILQAFIAAALTVISIAVAAAAVAAAPVTGGASVVAGLVAVSAMVGVVSSFMMVVDGFYKAQAGAKLEAGAQSSFNIQKLSDKYMPEIQYGIFSMITNLTGGDPAKAQEWFNIATAIITIISSGSEITAGRALDEAGNEVALSALQKAGKIYSLSNSSLSIAGLIANAADPDCSLTKNDGHTHGMTLWQSLSMGFMGALVYSIFETPLGSKTNAERLNDIGQYGSVIAESITLFALSIASACMEVLAREGSRSVLSAKLLSRQYWATLANMALQTTLQGEQIAINTFVGEKEADAMSAQADASKTSEELHLFEGYVQALTSSNTQILDSFIKYLSQSSQTYGAFLEAIKTAVDTNSRAVRSLFA